MVFLDGRFTIPNFPSRMLSYMEASLPLLIASDSNTDAGQIAESNSYGKWCEFGDLNKLLLNLDFFIKNPDLSKEMGKRGFEFLKANYSVEIAYNEIVNKIQNV